MNENVFDIVQAILSEPGVDSQDLAKRFSVSTRTIRSRIAQANSELSPYACIVSERSHGYSLDISDAEGFESCYRSAERALRSGLPDDSESRVQYLLNDLLCRTQWVTIDQLSEALYTSRRKVQDDLSHVERELVRYGLALERKPHYGIRVLGPEMSRRICLAHAWARNVRGMIGTDELDREIDDVAGIINAEIEGHLNIGSAVYQNLLIHIVIAIMRIRNGSYVSVGRQEVDALAESEEYEVAEAIATQIEKCFGVHLPEDEIAYICIHLTSKHVKSASDGEGMVISDEIWNMVGEMLDSVWETFRFDLRHDLELRMNLAKHLVPLVTRLRFHLDVKNPILEDIVARFPLAWAMGRESASVLARSYQTELSDDEVGFLALAYALALERRVEPCKKRILIVCASGAGTARLLQWQYLKEFGSYIESAQTCDPSELDSIDFKTIDYIFSTVPLNRELPVPVRQVGMLFDELDSRDIRDFLEGEQRSGSFARYFSEELFLPHLPQTTREEVLRFMCERIQSVIEEPEDYEQLVWERESVAPSAFGGRVAMPHPIRPVGEKTIVCVGLLDHDVTWGEHQVRVVFLVTISATNRKEVQGFYEDMVKLITDKEALGRLMAEQSWDAMSQIIASIERIQQ